MFLDKLTGNKNSYEPYKHIMQDTSSLYIGAKFSYEELLDNESLPFKMKAIISHYILKGTDQETTLESQFYYMTKELFEYEVYKQLKTKVKCYVVDEKKSKPEKDKIVYKEVTYNLNQIVDINLAKKKGMGFVISEICISKFALMAFSV